MRASDPGVERGGCVYAGVLGLGSGYKFCLSESDAGPGCDRGRTRTAPGDPLRQRAGADESPFSGVVLERQIELVHIQPGKPTQNAHVESSQGRLRGECLAVSWFRNLFDARRHHGSNRR